jgi:hypothetical protein
MRGCGLLLSAAALRRTLAILFCLFALCAPASADDISPLTNLDTGACDRLEDIHLQVGPPDAEIVAACQALRRSMIFSQSFSGGPWAFVLSLIGIVLTYAAFGVPMRALAGLMGRPVGRTMAAMSIEALLGLALRSIIGLLALVISELLPFAPAVGCLAIVGALIVSMRPRHASPPRPEVENVAATPSLFSVIAADLVNDAAASALGVLGLALLARADARVLGLGLAAAIVASIPRVVAARRRLCSHEVACIAIAAVLSGIFGVVAAADPRLAEALGPTMLPVLSIPPLFAIAVIGAAWMTGKFAFMRPTG